MISLQRKLVIFVLLVVCAPLYVLLRYFQGKSFFNMITGSPFIPPPAIRSKPKKAITEAPAMATSAKTP